MRWFERFFSVTAEDVVTEHAIRMSSGAMQVRNNSPALEVVYPLTEWIRYQQRDGKVYRRRVIVVDDWEEVEP